MMEKPKEKLLWRGKMTRGEKAEALSNIRLCDLNENTRKIYEDALRTIKEG